MYKFFRITIIFLFIGIFTSAVSAQELIIGVGGFEPHFIKKDSTGLFTDLIKEAFEKMPEYKITFWWDMSIRRLVKELNDGRIDVAAPVIQNSGIKGYISEPALRFTDVAITLKNRNFVITKISDLKNKSVIAYEGANLFLGKEFKAIAENNSDYIEVPEPMTSAKMLAVGRYDVCILDIYIFLHSIKNWREGKFTADQFSFHRLFPVAYAHMGFKDKKICDEFNQALKAMKDSGRYDAIYKRYLHDLGYSSD